MGAPGVIQVICINDLVHGATLIYLLVYRTFRRDCRTHTEADEGYCFSATIAPNAYLNWR